MGGNLARFGCNLTRSVYLTLGVRNGATEGAKNETNIWSHVWTTCAADRGESGCPNELRRKADPHGRRFPARQFVGHRCAPARPKMRRSVGKAGVVRQRCRPPRRYH